MLKPGRVPGDAEAVVLGGHFPWLLDRPGPVGGPIRREHEVPVIRPASPLPQRTRRTHAEIRVGDRIGAWTVVELLGRGFQGRSDLRIALQCDCGVSIHLFEFQARKHGEDTCTHEQKAAHP